MTLSQFQSLSTDQQGEILFTQGNYIAARAYYNHRINLYSLYDFFVEAWYFPPENRITELKVVGEKELDLYIDGRLEFETCKKTNK